MNATVVFLIITSHLPIRQTENLSKASTLTCSYLLLARVHKHSGSWLLAMALA